MHYPGNLGWGNQPNLHAFLLCCIRTDLCDKLGNVKNSNVGTLVCVNIQLERTAEDLAISYGNANTLTQLDPMLAFQGILP